MINKILYKNTTIIHKNIEIIGENAKSYFIKCNKCENDKILYNLPIEFPKGKRLKVECNCSKRFNEKQIKIITSRRCQNVNLTFIKWTEDFHGTKTKVTAQCENGHTVTTVTPDSLLKVKNGNGCRECQSKLLGKIKAGNRYSYKPDDVMVKEFETVGSYPAGTLFKRIDRQDTFNRKVYWKVTCSKCSVTCEQTGSEIKRGSKSCACHRGNCIWMYVHICKQDFEFVKYGIATNIQTRQKVLERRNGIRILKTFKFKFDTKQNCRNAETEIKRWLKNKPKNAPSLKDGHSEVASIKDLDGILCYLRSLSAVEEVIS